MTDVGDTDRDDTSCAGCGGAGLVRHGTRPVLRRTIGEDGRLVRETVAAQRFRCRDCGRSSVEAFDDAEIVEAIGDCAIRLGVAGAAARLEVDPGTVARMLARWIEARREDADAALPDAVALAPVRSGRPLRLMVSDPVEEAIVEIVDGIEGLKAHAAACGSAPSLVSIEVDAALARSVREIWPEATVAVPPAAAIRAASVAALASFRALVRAGVAQGRNFRERPHLLRIVNADLTGEQSEELRGWSAPLRRFRAAVLLLLDGLRTGGAEAFSDALARVMGALREIAPGGAMETFLSTWKDEMLAGVESRWLDRAWLAVEALRREIAAVRPSAGLDVLRAILVYSVPRSELPVPAPSFALATTYGSGAIVAGPRPLSGAMDALTALLDLGHVESEEGEPS